MAPKKKEQAIVLKGTRQASPRAPVAAKDEGDSTDVAQTASRSSGSEEKQYQCPRKKCSKRGGLELVRSYNPHAKLGAAESTAVN